MEGEEGGISFSKRYLENSEVKGKLRDLNVCHVRHTVALY